MIELLKTYFKVGDGVTREAVAQRCSVKKMFLKISQYSQEYSRLSPESLFLKSSGLNLLLLLRDIMVPFEVMND